MAIMDRLPMQRARGKSREYKTLSPTPPSSSHSEETPGSLADKHKTQVVLPSE